MYNKFDDYVDTKYDDLYKFANGLTRVGKCCTVMSFMCCCCCTKCGTISMNSIDVGEMWLSSLDIYKDIDRTKVENAYARALVLLSGRRTELTSLWFSNLFGDLYSKVRIRKLWKFDDKFEDPDEEFLVACLGFFYPALVDYSSVAIPKLTDESVLIRELAQKHFL